MSGAGKSPAQLLHKSVDDWTLQEALEQMSLAVQHLTQLLPGYPAATIDTAQPAELQLLTQLALFNQHCQKVLQLRAPQDHGQQSFLHALALIKGKDDLQAAKVMRQAAMAGHLKAQFYMGVLYSKGQGLPQSLFHAFSWFILAESQGSIEAYEARAKIAKHLNVEEIKKAQWLAADRYEEIIKTQC